MGILPSQLYLLQAAATLSRPRILSLLPEAAFRPPPCYVFAQTSPGQSQTACLCRQMYPNMYRWFVSLDFTIFGYFWGLAAAVAYNICKHVLYGCTFDPLTGNIRLEIVEG